MGFDDNIMLMTDGYKPSHWKMLPDGTTRIYSYMESRGGHFYQTLLFGLQYIMQRYMVGQQVTTTKIMEAARLYGPYFNGEPVFNIKGWQHIYSDHMGRLPLRIMATPEGTVLPTHTPMLTIENTCDHCAWLTTYIDSLIMGGVWSPTTVLSYSRACKQIIAGHLDHSGTMEELPFKLHDFGYRGSSSLESAAVNGAAHLVNFRGSDTIVGIALAQLYYLAGDIANSIPSSEHSIMSIWGEDGELDGLKHILQQYPNGYVGCVSDTYDLDRTVDRYWGVDLHDVVMTRNGTSVVRPDSGDPVETVVRTVESLADTYGTTYNAKGFHVLDPHIRVIQGDGIDMMKIDEILFALEKAQFSSDCVTFGMGGALLQKHDRDEQKFAVKASWAMVNGEARDVFKAPKGDISKISKAGRFTDGLELVYQNGTIMQRTSFTQIQARASIGV